MKANPILALTGVSLSLFSLLQAEVETSFSAGYTSDYVYRGGFIGNNLFDFGLEAAGSGELGGLGEVGMTAGVWYASFEGGNELDIYAEVSKEFEGFSLAGGITNYSYFGDGAAADDDIEPYVSVGTEMAGMSLGLAAYYDASSSYAYEFYWELSAGYEVDLGSTSLELTATYGYFDNDVDYVALSASLAIPVSDKITISPSVTTTFSDELDDETFGGVSVGFSF
ncbi:MAG: hypothetical protein CMP28_13885 [Roseibacillus sp.]|nr:hypothetical protein [Roseibacillus sp.]